MGINDNIPIALNSLTHIQSILLLTLIHTLTLNGLSQRRIILCPCSLVMHQVTTYSAAPDISTNAVDDWCQSPAIVIKVHYLQKWDIHLLC